MRKESSSSSATRWKSGKGYTLIELMIAIGLFAFVMTLTSGAYLMMIGATRKTQGIVTGIDNLAFALESMTRTIRTGGEYNCGGLGDCAGGANSFSVLNAEGNTITYTLGSQSNGSQAVGAIMANGVALTSPAINVTALMFYATGTSSSDALQPQVRISAGGNVSVGPGQTEPFSVETSATSRGIDL